MKKHQAPACRPGTACPSRASVDIFLAVAGCFWIESLVESNGVALMEAFVLEDIAYEPDLDRLREDLHIRPGTTPNDELEKLAAEARSIAKPKVLFKLAFVDSKDDTAIVVDGVTFRSRILRINLDSQHRVFPYAATCGTELDAWARSRQGILQDYLADMIAEQALEVASGALDDHIQKRFKPGTLSVMNPGSLSDWPIVEQRPLFELLGDTKKTIGVELNDGFMMIPIKSVSGIRFASEQSFSSCQLCPRQDCRGRRSPYDPELYERDYSSRS